MIEIFKKQFRRVKNILRTFIEQPFSVSYKGVKKYELLIFDDIFPHPVSGFRIEEFSELLLFFKKSKIVMTSKAYPIVKTPIEMSKAHVNEIVQANSQLKGKLQFKKGLININAKLFYCVFLNNIFDNLDWLEKYKIPFVFTLYPGGGFQVEDPISDMKLKKVFASPLFRKVIVTQYYTRDYLINNDFCKSEKIEYIFGGVVPQNSLKRNLVEKKKFHDAKPTFDICFCAAKYTPKGEDKGYDVFIDFAHHISLKYEFVRFHIIGGFTIDDIDVSSIKDKIVFYGYQNFEGLSTIYQKMDVLISPNKPFVLGKGSFDGFPLGTVIEAALNGVAVMVTDALHQNSAFTPNEEIIIIENNSHSIEKEIIDLITHPEKLYSISEKGREKFIQVYSNDVQMMPRITLLKNEILKA